MIKSQLHYITFMVQRPVTIISTLITIEIHFFSLQDSLTCRHSSKQNQMKPRKINPMIELHRNISNSKKRNKKNQIIRRRPPHLFPNFCIFKHEIKKRSRTQFCDANEKRVFRKIRGINDPFARHCRSIKKGIINPIGKLRKSRNFTALGQSARTWRTRVNI